MNDTTEKMRIVISSLVVLVVIPVCSLAQDNWPQFRGPDASGVGAGNPPTEWNVVMGENVLWKTSIPGLGHSSPIVWGDHVFVTTAVNSETDKPSLKTGWAGGSGDPAPDAGTWSWQILCLDRGTGLVHWRRTVREGEPTIKRHLKASHANCTPATDGRLVVAFFGSEGLYCFDYDGNLIWKKDFGRLHSGPYDAEDLEWGFSSSPVIHNGHVVVQCDCLNTGFISIARLEDGEEVRRIAREDVATWSTPCIVETNDRTQIVCNGFKQMASYDLDTGEQIWTLSGGGDVPVPTPLFHDGVFYLTNGHGRSPFYAIAQDALGDLTPENEDDLPAGLAWYQPRGGSYMPTPIIVDDLLYTCNDMGVLMVREASTGEQVYRRRVSRGGDNYSASAVAGGDHIYFSSEGGQVTVIKQGREYELVSTCDMGDTVMATPAVSGDCLFVRTTDHLYCIGRTQPASAAVQRWRQLWGYDWDTKISYRDFDLEFKYTQLKGIGFEKGVGRRDPTSIIKIGDLYHVWYTHFKSMDRHVGFEKADETSRAVTWDLCTIWHATSPDGVHWTEQGEAVPLGSKGEFDDRSVFTPDILVADGKYYLYYQAVSYPYTQRTENVIGMSWAESPDGPWHRHPKPILRTDESGEWVDPADVPKKDRVNFGWPITKKSAWDGHKVHDPTLIVRDGKYLLYYKGQPYGEGINSKRRRADKQLALPIGQGLAMADRPEGPFVKSPLNPVVCAGHESIFWPHGTGVACLMIQGPEAGTIQYARDGQNFYVMSHVDDWPVAAGVYRPGHFADITKEPAEGISWGICHTLSWGKDNWWPSLVRFDCVKKKVTRKGAH